MAQLCKGPVQSIFPDIVAVVIPTALTAHRGRQFGPRGGGGILDPRRSKATLQSIISAAQRAWAASASRRSLPRWRCEELQPACRHTRPVPRPETQPRSGAAARPPGQRLLGRYWRRIVLILVVVVAVIVVARTLEQRSEEANSASEIEVGLLRRGVTGEAEQELAAALRGEGISAESAASVVHSLLVTFGGADLSDLEVARLLAAWEDSDTAPHDDASRVLTQVADGLGVTREGLAGFVRSAAGEVYEREVPPAVILAGLSEHAYEYDGACELVEGASCPLEVVIEFVADRQQAEYEQWGHVDCGLEANAAHPGCVTFADCAGEYAVALAAQDASNDDWETAKALGHEPGSAGWEEWTAAGNDAVLSTWEAHESCIAERYGEGVDAFKALVLAR